MLFMWVANPQKEVLVEYLYLDLKTCDRCIGTDKVLDEVMMTLKDAIHLAGYEIEYKKIEMETTKLRKSTDSYPLQQSVLTDMMFLGL